MNLAGGGGAHSAHDSLGYSRVPRLRVRSPEFLAQWVPSSFVV